MATLSASAFYSLKKDAVYCALDQVRAGTDWQVIQHDLLNQRRFETLFADDPDEVENLTMEIIQEAEGLFARQEPHEDSPCLDAPWWATA